MGAACRAMIAATGCRMLIAVGSAVTITFIVRVSWGEGDDLVCGSPLAHCRRIVLNRFRRSWRRLLASGDDHEWAGVHMERGRPGHVAITRRPADEQ